MRLQEIVLRTVQLPLIVLMCCPTVWVADSGVRRQAAQVELADCRSVGPTGGFASSSEKIMAVFSV
jgi:hypothetical protein